MQELFPWGIDIAGAAFTGAHTTPQSRGDIHVAGGSVHEGWQGWNDQHVRDTAYVTTGGMLTLTAGEGVVLGAVEIKSTGSTDIDSPDVQFVAEKNLDYLSHTEWDTNLVYGVHEGHGHVEETLTLTRIDAQGGLNLPGNAHISAQLDAHQTTYTAAELRDLAVTLSSQPGLAWLNELSRRPDVDWQAIATAHQNWNYKQQGLTGVGAAVVAIVVIILTEGAGTELIGTEGAATTTVAADGAVATSTTVSVGATALSTTTETVAASGAVTTTTTYSALGTALNAGFTSLTSQAAISFINNGGDLGKTLDDLGSSATVKGIVSSMLTAGVAGSFGDTWSPGRLATQTVTGCAAAEIAGGKCKDGAESAFVMGGLTWGADEMRQNMIANSSQFKGICLGNTDQCENNVSGPSVGVNGDNTKLGGGRWDTVLVCRTQGFECTVDNGVVRVFGYGVDEMENVTPSQALQQVFDEHGSTLISPMGGIQGGGGYLKILGIGPGFYPKGSFWDKWVVEPFAGTHDMFNSPTTYDNVNDPGSRMFQVDFQGNPVLVDGNAVEVLAPRFVGNIKSDAAWLSKVMNVIDIPVASPFAVASIVNQLPPGIWQIIDNAYYSQNKPKHDGP